MKCLKLLQALAVFAGTVIGVGFLGLPYVAARAGFLPTLVYFLGLVPVVIILHCLLGEVACGTPKIARLPGYAEEYLGAGAKKIAFAAAGLGLLGALLAYLIVGGQFLYSLISPWLGGSVLIYTLCFFALGTILIYQGIKSIAGIEIILLIIFFLVLGIFFSIAWPNIETQNFSTTNAVFFILPYGVIMFSLWGASVVPEIKEILEGNRVLLRRVITLGTIIIALAYLFFIITILGVTGVRTSPEALKGFSARLGQRLVMFGYIFGIIATFTSFLTLGLTLKKILHYDFKISDKLAWFLACFIPLWLFFLGLDDFIQIIGLNGAVMIGIEAVMIILIYRAYLRQKGRRFNSWLYGLIILLALGIASEIVSFLGII